MKIVDMKVDRESAEEKAEMAAAVPNENPYPYGLVIRANEDVMEKLNLDEPLPVGTSCRIEAIGVVTETTDNESIGGKNVSMSIQITSMGIAPQKAGKSAANTLYGDNYDEVVEHG